MTDPARGAGDLPDEVDAVVVGAGHNGLVTAAVLARAGLDVLVLEAAAVVGGAARTEYPFVNVPELGASTGAYLLGLMPPELITELGLSLPLIRRDPHGFLPTVDDGYVILSGDRRATQESLSAFSGSPDARAYAAIQDELAALRNDLVPAWLTSPLSVEDTAERFVRPDLRDVFVELVRGSARDYLDRFGFADDRLRAMLALTDAFPGLHGSWDTAGSGHNFLVHNSGRLPGSDGTWMVARGGMGSVTAELARAAVRAGARVVTGQSVSAIVSDGLRVRGVEVGDGGIGARAVLVATDPWRLRDLAGGPALGDEVVGRIEQYATRPGTTLKVNLALASLPRFTCLPETVGQHGATIHLLPDAADPVGHLQRTFDDALAGRIPLTPAVEMYTHTAVDPSLQDAVGHHSAALFVQWVPHRPATGIWMDHADEAADRALAVVDLFAPGASSLVVDRQVLHPQAIEAHFGITGGNIFHVDNTFSFDQRLPYRMACEGLYACGAGCHPAGSVIGAAGWNAARLALDDLFLGQR